MYTPSIKQNREEIHFVLSCCHAPHPTTVRRVHLVTQSRPPAALRRSHFQEQLAWSAMRGRVFQAGQSTHFCQLFCTSPARRPINPTHTFSARPLLLKRDHCLSPLPMLVFPRHRDAPTLAPHLPPFSTPSVDRPDICPFKPWQPSP